MCKEIYLTLTNIFKVRPFCHCIISEKRIARVRVRVCYLSMLQYWVLLHPLLYAGDSCRGTLISGSAPVVLSYCSSSSPQLRPCPRSDEGSSEQNISSTNPTPWQTASVNIDECQNRR